MLQGQVSRREVLGEGLKYSALAAVFLTGCGGLFGGGGGAGASSSISGTIVLPAGIIESDVSIIGMGREGLVNSGTFHADIDTSAPSWVLALHKPGGKIIGMGVFDSTNTIHTIDATSAAVALLFMALDGSSMPKDGRKPLLDLIKASAATAALATSIQTLLASDPYAYETASTTLQAAVETAAGTFSTSTITHGLSQGLAQSQSNDLATLMLIEPSNEVDGLTVLQDPSILGFEVQNERRRNSLMYTYLVAHVDDNGSRTDITPQQIGNALEIPSTHSLLNLRNGWHPVTSPVVPLKLQGQDKKSIFELVALNTVFGANDPSIYQLERYSGVVNQWKEDVRNLHATMALGYVAGIMFDAVGIGGATYGISQLTATITNLTAVSSDLTSLLIGAQDGFALIPLTKQVIGRFLTGSFLSPDGIRAFGPLLEKAEGQIARDLAAGSANSSVYVAMRAALRIFLAVGVIGLAGDLAAVAIDTSTGNRGDLFTVTLFEPKVGLTPANGTYTPGSSMSIQASAPGVPTSHLSFHWKLSGSNLANLSDGTTVGNDFTSTSNHVNLATTPSTIGNLTVTVTVTDTTTSTVVGSASAIYATGSVQEYASILQPFGPNGYYPQGGGHAIVYMPIPLDAGQKIVKIQGTHDRYGTISYNIKLPQESTAISHTSVVTAGQLFGGTAAINNGTIYNLNYHSNEGFTTEIVGQCTVWWNYGDEAWMLMAIATWDNRGANAGVYGSGGDALAAAKDFATKAHFTNTPA